MIKKSKFWFIIGAIIMIGSGLLVVYTRPIINDPSISNQLNWLPFIFAMPFMAMGVVRVKQNDPVNFKKKFWIYFGAILLALIIFLIMFAQGLNNPNNFNY